MVKRTRNKTIVSTIFLLFVLSVFLVGAGSGYRGVFNTLESGYASYPIQVKSQTDFNGNDLLQMRRFEQFWIGTQNVDLTTSARSGNIDLPNGSTIVGAYAKVRTAPTGATILVDIHKNGTTIFTDQDGRITIDTTEYSSTVATPDVTSYSYTDSFEIQVDQVGSSVAGQELNVVVEYY